MVTPSASDLSIDDPCLLFALRREMQAFLREFRPQQRFAGAPCWARFCGPAWLSVLVLETGIGPQRMERALTWLLDQPAMEQVVYRPKLVLSAGFSAAAQPGLRVGDIIVATEVVDEAGNRWPTTWPDELEGEWRPKPQRGRLLSVSRLVADAQEKSTLGQRHEALAIDMETAVVARLCSRKSVPFGCVRSISDDVTTSISAALVPLLSSGTISLGRVLMTVLRNPSIMPELWKLAQATRHAGEQLGTVLGELLTLTLPFGKEL